MRLEIPKGHASNISIEMPMLFKDGADMASYFGGTTNLQTIQHTKTPFLPVKLRPREPNAKPIFADRAKTQTFLLHVTKKKRSHGELSGKIATVTHEKFVCEGMVDYQYLAANQYTERANDPLDVRLRTYLEASTQDDLELIPEVFSRVDLPLKYEFKQRPMYNETQTPSSDLKQVPRHFFTYANFRSNSPVPQEVQRLPKTRGKPMMSMTPSTSDLVEIRGTRRLVSETVTPLVLLPKSKKKSHRRMPYRSRLNTVFQVNDVEDKVAMHLKKKKAHNRSLATVKATTGDDDRRNAALVIYGVPLREGFFYVQLCDLVDQNPAVKAFVAPFQKRLRSSASVGRPAEEINVRQAQIDRAVRNAMEELEGRGGVDSEEDKPSTKDEESKEADDDDVAAADNESVDDEEEDDDAASDDGEADDGEADDDDGPFIESVMI
ncbi:hypothetical protein DYB28_009144 [Aphanomyces astaci]|uniref:Transcription factor IIIC subunit Tfc1/Sfc1 triple barrel domain-containing protein n=1 Tax=Aphanomyces astaci TaxID=112090 RepID=A0A9X8E987_APHAT|nr:hypothetical protein DYB28_009144 [Aphanomyces astaci]